MSLLLVGRWCWLWWIVVVSLIGLIAVHFVGRTTMQCVTRRRWWRERERGREGGSEWVGEWVREKENQRMLSRGQGRRAFVESVMVRNRISSSFWCCWWDTHAHAQTDSRRQSMASIEHQRIMVGFLIALHVNVYVMYECMNVPQCLWCASIIGWMPARQSSHSQFGSRSYMVLSSDSARADSKFRSSCCYCCYHYFSRVTSSLQTDALPNNTTTHVCSAMLPPKKARGVEMRGSWLYISTLLLLLLLLLIETASD